MRTFGATEGIECRVVIAGAHVEITKYQSIVGASRVGRQYLFQQSRRVLIFSHCAVSLRKARKPLKGGWDEFQTVRIGIDRLLILRIESCRVSEQKPQLRIIG